MGVRKNRSNNGIRWPGPAVAAMAADQPSASARGTKRVRPLSSTSRAEGVRLGRPVLGMGSGASGGIRAVVPEVWPFCLLILLRVVAGVIAAARITGVFLVLIIICLAGRLLLAAEVLGVALIRVARPGSSWRLQLWLWVGA